MPEHQILVLKSQTGDVVKIEIIIKICEISNENLPLRSYGVQHGMEIYVIDSNPYSLAKNGGLEDVNLVEKYVMPEAVYNEKENTVRAYIKKQKEKKEKEMLEKGAPGEDTVSHCVVGSRCEVSPGGRRGEIKWVGKFPGEDNNGYWVKASDILKVGIQLDEPSGKSNGSRKGHVLFVCENNYGTFARGRNVEGTFYLKYLVGDFPDLLLAELNDGDEL